MACGPESGNLVIPRVGRARPWRPRSASVIMERGLITETGSGASSVTGLASGVGPQLVSDLVSDLAGGWPGGVSSMPAALLDALHRGHAVRLGTGRCGGCHVRPAEPGTWPLAAVPGGSPGRAPRPVPAPQAHRGDSGAADTWPQPQLCHIDGAPAQCQELKVAGLWWCGGVVAGGRWRGWLCQAG